MKIKVKGGPLRKVLYESRQACSHRKRSRSPKYIFKAKLKEHVVHRIFSPYSFATTLP